MRLTVCIATRGHPIDLLRVIEETDKRVAQPDQTTISIAFDGDDDAIPTKPQTRCNLVWDIAPREDSLGAKYNRCARNAPADFYVLGADDNIFITEAWDDVVRNCAALFSEKFGFVYFGRLDGTLPTQMAIPHKLIDAQGYLFPEHWPFWFHDTWVDEIAHSCGRILWCDVKVEEIGGRGKSRGVREVPFWTNLFLAMKQERETIAEVLSQTFNQSWFHTQLLQRRDILRQFFAMRMERMRNPATAIHFERRMSYDAAPDERYSRIKANAEAVLASLRKTAA